MAPSHRAILQTVEAFISPLLPELHKGQAGRVGVLGGSRDYTGAPFYASMSSMRVGCDMSFTMCAPEAAPAIKSYSPDLIVQPILDKDSPVDEVRDALRSLFGRLHSIVIGPGLGREAHMQAFARIAIEEARAAQLYTVVDADGLWLLQNAPDLIAGYKRAVLTPNVVEFGRLCTKLNVAADPTESAAQRLSLALGGPTILEKGRADRIATPTETLVCDVQGGLKRCGGQGDLLGGTLGTFLAWAKRFEERRAAGESVPQDIPTENLPQLAAYGASTLTRTASHRGFTRLGRSMLADDLLCELGPAYEALFGKNAL